MTMPMITEREATIRARNAWVEGRRASMQCCSGCEQCAPTIGGIEREAMRLYPLPKVERPRVVADVEACYEFRCTNGQIEERFVSSNNWYTAVDWTPTPERVAIWAALIANPTELVDAEP